MVMHRYDQDHHRCYHYIIIIIAIIIAIIIIGIIITSHKGNQGPNVEEVLGVKFQIFRFGV
jgi:hypothetical protein